MNVTFKTEEQIRDHYNNLATTGILDYHYCEKMSNYLARFAGQEVSDSRFMDIFQEAENDYFSKLQPFTKIAFDMSCSVVSRSFHALNATS